MIILINTRHMQPPKFVVWEQYVTVANIKQHIDTSMAAIIIFITFFRTLLASLPRMMNAHAALPHLDNLGACLLNFPEVKPPSKKPG